MGLLQEWVLALQLRPAIWSHLLEGQSRYIRSSDNPILALSELRQLTVTSQSRCIFVLLVMGDFQKAFPSCWRDDILHLAAECPLVSGGSLHLLGDILDSDLVAVCLGGFSILLFPFLKAFLKMVALAHPVPTPARLSCTEIGSGQLRCCNFLSVASKKWTSHLLCGKGVPQPSFVAPSPPRLGSVCFSRPGLAGPSAAPCSFHADDPLFLTSSWRELCCVALMVER